MSLYRLIPRTVEAVFYNGANEFEVGAWCKGHGASSVIASVPADEDVTMLIIKVDGDDWYLWPDRWIAVDPEGGFELYSPKYFAAEFEPVPEAER